MNLLRTIFMIPMICIIFGNQSYAMQTSTLKELLEMSKQQFEQYQSNISVNGDHYEKIFFTSVYKARVAKKDPVKVQTYDIRYFFRPNGIYDPTNEDWDDLMATETLLYDGRVLTMKQDKSDFKQSDLKKCLRPGDTAGYVDTLKKTNNNSTLPSHSKFSSIIQTLRNNTKLVLGGTVFCVAVLSGCAYALYKNKMKIKKEDNKTEDEIEKDDFEILIKDDSDEIIV